VGEGVGDTLGVGDVVGDGVGVPVKQHEGVGLGVLHMSVQVGVGEIDGVGDMVGVGVLHVPVHVGDAVGVSETVGVGTTPPQYIVGSGSQYLRTLKSSNSAQCPVGAHTNIPVYWETAPALLVTLETLSTNSSQLFPFFTNE
jgi:hypothetical protein